VSVKLSQTNDANLIQLDGEVDIASAADLKAALIEAAKDKKEIRVSAEGASSLDVTAYQLLWAAKREAKRANAKFSLPSELPETIRRAWTEMGLDDLASPA
jgi:anti-anti-sigma factor